VTYVVCINVVFLRWSVKSDNREFRDKECKIEKKTFAAVDVTFAVLLLLSSIISMMRLLLDVSSCFCPTPEPLLVLHSTSLLRYLLLHCPSISSFVFLRFFSHWYSSVMLLLAAVRFPFLIHARTNLVFCQPVSFRDTEYHAQSHFSSYHVLLLSTIFLTMSFLLQGFVFHLLSSSTNILNRTAVLELRRFHTALL